MKKLIGLVLFFAFIGGAMLFAAGAREDTQMARIATPIGQYPIDAAGTPIRYWLPLGGSVNPNYVNVADTPLGQALIRMTGVDIRFEHPPSAATNEAFNLLIAARDDMPDLIEWNWLTLPGGPQRYIDDGVILNLNGPIQRYAPYLRDLLASNPEYDRMVKTDEGNYYNFPFIRGDELLFFSGGMMIRKDWLDELGLQTPTTIPEWNTVLTAFRNRGVQAPLTMNWANRSRVMFTTFDFQSGMYFNRRNNRMDYGEIQPGFREWVELFTRWYAEGLLDRDLISVTAAQINQKMISGSAGSTQGAIGGGMGVWTTAGRLENPRYEIVAARNPVRNRGDELLYAGGVAFSGQSSVAISPYSNNVELATRVMDFGYTPDGHLLYNFGVEGESWTWVDNTPTYTEFVMTGSGRNWPLAQSLAAYVRSISAGPFVQDVQYILQYYDMPEQSQALWNFYVPGASAFQRPPLTPTSAESTEMANIMQAVNTFVEERTVRWILGNEPLNDATWSEFVATINRMGIQRAIDIENAALQRYRNR